jgi:hypothetical protein
MMRTWSETLSAAKSDATPSSSSTSFSLNSPGTDCTFRAASRRGLQVHQIACKSAVAASAAGDYVYSDDDDADADDGAAAASAAGAL